MAKKYLDSETNIPYNMFMNMKMKITFISKGDWQ